LSFVPTPLAIAIIATEMPAAIRAYSIAVAAVSSLKECPEFPHHTKSVSRYAPNNRLKTIARAGKRSRGALTYAKLVDQI